MAIPDVPKQKIRPHSFLPVLLKYLREAEGINDLKDLVATHHLEALEVRDGWFWVEKGVVDVAHDFLFQKLKERNKRSLGRNSKNMYKYRNVDVSIKRSWWKDLCIMYNMLTDMGLLFCLFMTLVLGKVYFLQVKDRSKLESSMASISTRWRDDVFSSEPVLPKRLTCSWGLNGWNQSASGVGFCVNPSNWVALHCNKIWGLTTVLQNQLANPCGVLQPVRLGWFSKPRWLARSLRGSWPANSRCPLLTANFGRDGRDTRDSGWVFLGMHGTVDGWNPAPVDRGVIPYRVPYIPGGAGFQPSTVSLAIFVGWLIPMIP